ncbi:hypothetical protein, partial [uncultured Prevotella sp.]|uniref:hypothetical protein n=1 Tax=uncultured Prevotella sp. TaxID=159272 RepID=UPI00262C80F8
PLWAAAIGIISCYASLHLHLFGENNLNQKKTFSNTVPTAPMPSTRSISAARSSHSTICTQLQLVECGNVNIFKIIDLKSNYYYFCKK